MKRDSITLRIVLSIFVIGLLIIPLTMIQSLISERESYRDEVVKEINKSWAAKQVVAGPILTIINNKWVENEEGKKYLTQNNYHLLPENLKYETELIPETRYRGIYEVTLYEANIRISGYFDFDKTKMVKYEELLLNSVENYLSFSISDLKGIQGNLAFNWNNEKKEVNPGLKTKELFRNGFTTEAAINKNDKKYYFDVTVKLKGSENLEFIPLGKTTEVSMRSNWNNPSFTGNFLPSSREVNADGFTAKWNINHFNREYPQEWHNNKYELYPSSFGVKLLVPVDEYQKAMRTSKYGIMIILLTFVSFFMIEIFSKKVLHPIQYLLIGFSLVIFYSILLSLSEYLLFQYSYLSASLLVVSLISLYTSSIYGNYKLGMLIGAFLILFYGFMYIILQLQDYSLLLGNIALFIVLATVMYLTRKINWYDVLSSKNNLEQK
ncbi:MAG: cell envelope integrity protein CreD [Ignavibacteriaceae bacterium]|nr:cell envelope integrity protein CreD [Ignavibacteriaceae bacterium]